MSVAPAQMAQAMAISRRLKERLPREDIAAINAPQPGLIPENAPRFAGQVFADASGRIIDPADVTPGMATELGRQAGSSQVSRRLIQSPGQFIDPATGGPAQLGTGAFLSRPAMFMPSFMPGGPSMDEHVREVGNAVRRRLEELTGALPSQPQFQSPAFNPFRGRFGT